MSAREFRRWMVYRKRRGFVLHNTRDLMGRLTWAYSSVHRGKDSTPPELGEFLLAHKTFDETAAAGTGRYLPHELQSISALTGDKT